VHGRSMLPEQYGDRPPKKLDASGRWTAMVKGQLHLMRQRLESFGKFLAIHVTLSYNVQ